MADITWGPEYPWIVLPADHQASQMVSCRLSDDKFVIAYVYISTHGADPAQLEGRALVGVVSGTAISYGPDAVFRQPMETQVSPLAICRLDDNKFVVFYKIRTNGLVDGHAWARVGTVSGDTITWGVAVNISGSNARYLSCCRISDSKFLMTWHDTGMGNVGRACVATVVGDTITPGGLTTVLASRWTPVQLEKIGTDKIFGVWRDYLTGVLDGAVFTISGTIPTMHTEQVIDTRSCKRYFISYMGNDKVVVTWTEGVLFVNQHGQACIVEISGNSFTFGAFVETQEALPVGQGPYHPDVVAIGEANFLFVFSIPDANHGHSRWGTVIGNVITLGDKEEWSTAGCSAKDVLFLKENYVAMPFIEGLAGPEKAIIGTWTTPLVLARKGNIVTDQLIFQHCERMR